MEQQSFSTHTLPCGLRIVCAPGQTDVVYLGVAAAAGTRHELSSEGGMAHFTEHMSFKGTQRRSARQVISAMESVGGELNAFTGKEETVYYCTCLNQHVSRAIDLLLDIVFCSTYPQEEMNREVEVVIDEIESYQDQPSELIYDEFESLMFPGHPLGRNILGDAGRLRTYRTDDMRRFVHRLYHPDRMVFYVLGNVDSEKVFRMVERNVQCHDFSTAPEELLCYHEKTPIPLREYQRVTRKKNTHQSHVIVGAQAFGGNDPRHLHMHVLSNMLGGPAMSSRLNLALRERNGLVYTVESSNVTYTDNGLWTVYYGCDAADMARCRRLVDRELSRLTDRPMSQRTLGAARRQLKGQMGISYDNFENVAIGMAKRYLHYGHVFSRQTIFEQIDAITPEDLLSTAQTVFNSKQLMTLEYV